MINTDYLSFLISLLTILWWAILIKNSPGASLVWVQLVSQQLKVDDATIHDFFNYVHMYSSYSISKCNVKSTKHTLFEIPNETPVLDMYWWDSMRECNRIVYLADLRVLRRNFELMGSKIFHSPFHYFLSSHTPQITEFYWVLKNTLRPWQINICSYWPKIDGFEITSLERTWWNPLNLYQGSPWNI